ncbi:hypothetical protein [Microbacterium sp.]|uniref:hypothetical protein n=1 Tax=Microbacterium sp. TaxID=51671 RepID=UPI0028112E50|nr:hypothetical protein [Microbacterium sp.]
MDVDPSYDARQAAFDAASSAQRRAMTAFEEHLADAIVNMVLAIEQLDSKLDTVLSAQRPAEPS